MVEMWNLDASGMAAAVRRGDMTAEALVLSCFERLSSIGTELNAVVAIERDSALITARSVDAARKRGDRLGPLAGVPLAHKDMFYRAGRASGRGLKPSHEIVPSGTAPLLARLDGAGAVDVARLQMAEIALSPTGRNVHYGPPRNPWHGDYAPGGSSSGSAVAVAARLVPASLGSDTGGSIRHPAAMCGLLGLKPTQDLLSLDGLMPLAPSLDCPGLLTRTARDMALVLAILQGRDPSDSPAPATNLKGLTVAVPDGLYRSAVAVDVLKAVDASIAVLKEAGATILGTASPDLDRLNRLSHCVLAYEAALVNRHTLMASPENYSPEIRGRIEPGLALSPDDYAEALRMRDAVVKEWLATVMGNADLVHIPTLSVPTPTLDEAADLAGGSVPAVNAKVTANTRGINYLGLPAMAVPCGFLNGLPASFQLIGRRLGEATLLRAAQAYQALTPWHEQAPPIGGSV